MPSLYYVPPFFFSQVKAWQNNVSFSLFFIHHHLIYIFYTFNHIWMSVINYKHFIYFFSCFCFLFCFVLFWLTFKVLDDTWIDRKNNSQPPIQLNHISMNLHQFRLMMLLIHTDHIILHTQKNHHWKCYTPSRLSSNQKHKQNMSYIMWWPFKYKAIYIYII